MEFAFGLVVFLTILAWLIVFYIIYKMWDHRRKPRGWNQVVGTVDRVYETEDGAYVEGTLNDDGKKLLNQGQMAHMSIGFNHVVSETEDGSRLIKQARIHSTSIDAVPGPYGGKIESVERKDEGKTPNA